MPNEDHPSSSLAKIPLCEVPKPSTVKEILGCQHKCGCIIREISGSFVIILKSLLSQPSFFFSFSAACFSQCDYFISDSTLLLHSDSKNQLPNCCFKLLKSIFSNCFLTVLVAVRNALTHQKMCKQFSHIARE